MSYPPQGSGATSVYDITDLLPFLQAQRRMGTLVSLAEWWMGMGVDMTIWLPGGVTSVFITIAEAAYQKVIFAPAAGVDSRLVSVQTWPVGAFTTARRIARGFLLTFEARLVNVANIDNTTFFLGLSPGMGSTRLTDNIIGFGLLGDALRTITDLGGVETVGVPAGIVLTEWNKYRIYVRADGSVQFLINEAVSVVHTTNIPLGNFFLQLYVDNEAAVQGELHLGPIVVSYIDADITEVSL